MGKGRPPAGFGGVGGDDIEDVVAVGEGKILEEDRIGEREYGRVDSDAEG
jgi:hypothetical protein